LADALVNDPETVAEWRETVFLKHQKLSDLITETEIWLKGMQWLKASETFHFPYITNQLLKTIFGLD
jgi:hypothetical protein